MSESKSSALKNISDETEENGYVDELDKTTQDGEESKKDALSPEDILVSMLKKEEPPAEDLKPYEDNESGHQAANAIFTEVQHTLESLSSSDSAQHSAITKLKEEYDKLNKLLMESRKNEGQLMKKCKDMTSELSANARKIQTALKLSQSDRGTIAALQKEVKKAWKQVETNAEKEARNKDLIASLRNEVETLRGGGAVAATEETTAVPSTGLNRHKLIELQMEQEDELRKVTKEKLLLEADYQNLVNELKQSKIDLEDRNEKIKGLMEERTATEEEMLTLKDFLASKKSEQDREIRAREKVDSALRQAMEAVDRKEDEMKLKALEAKTLKENMIKLDNQLQNERFRSEKLEKERDQLFARNSRLQQEFDDRNLEAQKLSNQSHDQRRILEVREDELDRLKDNLKQSSRAKDAMVKKQKALEEAKMNTEMERDALRSTNAHLNHDIEILKKEVDQLSKQLEMVSRERDLSQKNLIKSTTATQKQFNVLKISEQAQRNLEQEIQGYKDEAQKMRKLIYTLEKERDNRFNEAAQAEQALKAQEEDMKMKDMIIFDCKKKITEFEKKLKEQQALYENVRADRNVYSKNLIESQDEISEMKRKVKIMNHQVDQLKEEIASKEAGNFL